jgi:hypothetical protein
MIINGNVHEFFYLHEESRMKVIHIDFFNEPAQDVPISLIKKESASRDRSDKR